MNGTVSGRSVLANNAIFTTGTTTTNGQTITSWDIDVTTYADACGCVGGADVQVVSLGIGTIGTTIPPGTYSFGPATAANPQGATAGAHYYLAGPSLSPTVELLQASSGSIDISEISASEVVGNFDVSFPSGDQVTGTFTAPLCANTTPSADAAACK